VVIAALLVVGAMALGFATARAGLGLAHGVLIGGMPKVRLAFTVTPGRYADSPEWLVVSNLDGSGRHALTPRVANRRDSDPVWSPDGSRVAFSRSGSGTDGVYVINADNTGLRRIVAVRASQFVADISWSRDGSRLAFVRSSSSDFDTCSHNADLLVVNADGSHVQALPALGPKPSRGPYLLVSQSWSGDGTKLLYIVDKNCGVPSDARTSFASSSLYAIRTDGSQRQLLARDAEGSMTTAAWSPDGTHVSYTDGCVQLPGANDYCDVGVVEADGHGQRRLTMSDDADTSLGGWTPDSRQIVFGNKCEMHHCKPGVSLLDVSTGHVKLLAAGSFPFDLMGSPDGTKVGAVTSDKHGLVLVVVTLDGRQHWRFPAPRGWYPGESSHEELSFYFG
jgi:Tol biopolymer transport system component